MGINWDNIGWTESDDFIHFAFGSFNSKTFSTNGQLVRTSNGNRYNRPLTPPLETKTIDIPGRNGAYYFQTNYKPKVIDVAFAFQGLSDDDLKTIKAAFRGDTIQELSFSEDCTYNTTPPGVTDSRIYMAKITGQPSLKVLSFGDGNSRYYNGEGNLQFTAYWPFCRGKNTVTTNNGDIDAPFTITYERNTEAEISFGDVNKTYGVKIASQGPFQWSSISGFIEGAEKITSLEFYGNVPKGTTYNSLANAAVTMYNWYY